MNTATFGEWLGIIDTRVFKKTGLGITDAVKEEQLLLWYQDGRRTGWAAEQTIINIEGE